MGKGPSDAKTRGLLELDDPAADVVSGFGTLPPPTVVPSFDPSKYAAEAEFRERMPTITDETALEQARLQTLPSNRPPVRPLASTVPPAALLAASRDSTVEIDLGEEELEALGVDEQTAILSERLAPLSRVPRLAQEVGQLGALLADPKTAYVLGFVDGLLPLETIIDVTGLPELDTLRVLERMVAQGVLVFPAA